MKTLIFFGSGADTDFYKELPSGKEFIGSLLVGDHHRDAVTLCGKSYKSYRLLYPGSTKVFLQTIYTYPEKAKEVINPDIVDNCINYLNNKTENKGDDIREYCKEWYKIVTNEESNKEVQSFFWDNAVFFDTLDEKFNSLRNLEFNDSAKRIIVSYTSVFLMLFKRLYNLENDFQWTYDAIIKKLNEPYDIPENDSSYYSDLGKSDLKTKIVTTNYTELAERYSCRETIYLHGRMTWFEDLKRLTVYDCTKEYDRKLIKESQYILPFILIPSGVKPLICTRQILEYAKFIEALREADVLYAIGYKFNSEDNHVNSIIAEWLREEGHKLICLNFNQSVDFSVLNWAEEFPVSLINKDHEKNLRDSMDSSKIIDIPVGPNTARKTFSIILKYLKDIQDKSET